MTERSHILGIDPGPTPGLVRFTFDRFADGTMKLASYDVVQCSAGVLWSLLPAMAEDAHRIAVERFVSRGRESAEQRETRAQAEAILQLHPLAVARSAGQVKPWATDVRLERLGGRHGGVLKALAGMRHARDAARHALFCAVHDAGLPDPLSKEYRR